MVSDEIYQLYRMDWVEIRDRKCVHELIHDTDVEKQKGDV